MRVLRISPLGCWAVAVVALGASVARADDEDPARVQVVQRRQFNMKHELTLGAGFLPLDAFYKGITLNVAYTFHFSDNFAWRVGRGALSHSINTGLRKQLEQQFGLQVTDTPEVRWFAGSDLIWNAFYGKSAFMNSAVLHMALYLLAGATVMGIQTGFTPAVNVGGGLRFFATDWLSLRIEASDHIAFLGKTFSVIDLQLAAAVNFGG